METKDERLDVLNRRFHITEKRNKTKQREEVPTEDLTALRRIKNKIR